MAVATYEDVAVAIGRPISDTTEQAQVTYWLDAVELQIKARLGDVADLDQDVLKYVEVEAVATKMQNPNGYQSETIDDYTYRFGTETRRVTILDEWWQLLDPDSSAPSASIRPGFEPDRVGWAAAVPPYFDPEWDRLR
ncbi:hypothetical protein [Nocardioides kribbensis]|uniref:hypothetical protein n=1 Tax=Nocardioides kribbensis TaxID=305517 RepID=UPI0018796AE4|nr:hypothetical protein [Nocardioides kribbensis]